MAPEPRVAISRLHCPVETLGPGRRAGIWFQGCSLHCPGCLSRDTWAPGEAGTPVGVLVDWVEAKRGEGIDGVTVSGGEPFDQPEALEALLGAVRRRPSLGDVDLFAFSGYTLGVLRRRWPGVLGLLDAVMTGPYVESRPTELPWRGSANQKLAVLSERGASRFGAPASGPRLQVGVAGGAIWLTGVPRRGDLAALERRLGELGVRLEEVSWNS